MPVPQITEIWKRLKPGQRIVVVSAAVATLALAGALVIYGSRAEYGVLFSDLKPADAQAIVEKLKSAGVAYQLSNGGTTVNVPADRVAEMRLQMAAAGALTGGHVGFDLFDKNSFGATDFAQQVNYQRALAGELSRTLEAMDEVESARVHITPARNSVFLDKAERAKSSVMLRVRQGRELSRERTESVVNLVASAVEGLDPADVSVMDARGRLLSAPGGAGASGAGEAGAFNSHLESRRRFEAETAARIVSLLEPVVGAGRVRADVSAELDFSQVEQTEEKYDPQSAVVRSQQSTQELRSGAQAGNNLAAGGVAGARANDPDARAAVAPQRAAATGDQRTATTTNYEIDKIVRRTIGGGGRITRLSASVVVDYKTQNGVAAARTSEELGKLQELVSAAVGLNSERGDQLVVQSIPFDQPTVGEVAPPTWLESNKELARTAVKYGLLVVAALVIVLFVVRPARRALRAASVAAPPQLPPAGGAPGGMRVGDALNAAGAYAGLQSAGALTESGGPRTVAELEEEMKVGANSKDAAASDARRAVRSQLVARSQSEPEMVAMTLRGWLRETKA